MALPFTKLCKKWKTLYSTIVLSKKKLGGGGVQNNRFMEKWKVFPFFYKFKKKLHVFFPDLNGNTSTSSSDESESSEL